MKNKLTVVLILTLLTSSSRLVMANEVAEPFIVSQAIHYDTIEPDLCISLIRNHSTSTDTSSEASYELVTRIDEVQVEIDLLNTDYQMINNRIASLESGDDQSLTEGQWQLDSVVETIYHDYLTHDESFSLLTQEEQLGVIAEHPTVMEWQNYLLEIQQLINELVAERDAVEAAYYQLTYEFDNLISLLEAEKSNQAQLNQCLLYPYSLQYMSSDQMMLNQQIPLLADYLVELDFYLQKLVPTPYRKITYYDIYRLFSYPADNSMITDYSNKQPIRFDETGLFLYTYAKELSLYDIEIVADTAKAAYTEQVDLNVLTSSYQNALDLKALQFDYFYHINPEAFEWLKEQLAAYLNQNEAYDEQSIQLVQTIHNRYQIKLVLLDEANNQWEANAGGYSGYYGQYYDAPLLEPLPVNQLSGNLMTAEEQSASESSSIADQTKSSSLENSADSTNQLTQPKSENLNELKDKLSQSSLSDSQAKLDNLAKPQDLSSSSKVKPTKKSSQLKLPDTGEQRFYLYLGIGLLIVGLCLLFANQRIRRHKREQLEEIKLD